MTSDQAMQAISAAVGRIAPEVDISRLDPEADLREELELDSMDFLNIVVELDEKTGVVVPEQDYPAFATLSGAVSYLVSHSPVAG